MCFKQNHPKFVFLIVKIDFHVIVMNQTPLLAQLFWSRPHDWVLLALPLSWLRKKKKITLKTMFFLPGPCGLAVFCPKTQNMSLIFLFTLLHFWLKYIFSPFLYYITLIRYWFYGTDHDVLHNTGWTALQKEHTEFFAYHEFVAMFFMPFVSQFLFSFNQVPIKTPWEQERMGNSFGAIVLWKTTINMMPVFGAFLVIKIHLKKNNYIVCVFEIICTICWNGFQMM